MTMTITIFLVYLTFLIRIKKNYNISLIAEHGYKYKLRNFETSLLCFAFFTNFDLFIILSIQFFIIKKLFLIF